MKLDSSSSLSTADETVCLPVAARTAFPKGNPVSGSDLASGAAIETYPKAKADGSSKGNETQDCDADVCTSWSYLFVHNQKVRAIEERLRADGLTVFVHRSMKYVPRHGKRRGAHEVTVPSVSGLIFVQGSADRLQAYLACRLPHHHLCKNCSTGRVAVIPNSQMVPFMRVAETEPERIRFLLRPFVYYAQNRTLLRIVSGDFAGLEGYVIRIARDRRLVMNVGGMSVAIAGIHAERFEEVGKNEADKLERATFYKRNLHERNAFIDRYFHRVKTLREVAAQAENIDILRLQTLADMKGRRIDAKDAYATFRFIIEEIGYYYAPFVDLFHDDLRPIFDAGRLVLQEIDRTVAALRPDSELRLRCEADYEELVNSYGYLFE